MTNIGNYIKTSIYRIAKDVFSFDFGDYLKESQRNFYGLIINHETCKFEPLFGDVPADFIALLNPTYKATKATKATKAGYEVNVGVKFGGTDIRADVFLIDKQVMHGDVKIIDGLILHELCHMYIESKYLSKFQPKMDKADLLQGEKIYEKTGRDIMNDITHDEEYYQVLSWAANRMRTVDTRYKNRWDAIKSAMTYNEMSY